MSKQMGIMGWVLCLLSGGLLMWGLAHATPTSRAHFDNPAVWDDSAAAVPVTSKDPMWGSRFAPVTIVVFSDYQCPHCKSIEDTYAQLKQKYGGDKLRIIWKHNPLAMHPAARPASEAGVVVMNLGGNDAFWRFHEQIFDDPKAINAEALTKWAVEAGVDKQKFVEAVAANAGADKVKEDLANGAKNGVRGTPAAFINGEFRSGKLPEAEFVKLIDAELFAANELLKSGTPPDQIYVKRSLANKPPKDSDPKMGPKGALDDKPDSVPGNATTKEPAKEAATDAPEKDTAEEATEAALAKKEKPADVVHKIPVGASLVRGPADALVTIVEFGDLSCPYTAAAEPALLEVMKIYDGKVRLVWKHHPMPVNARSMPTTLLALEAQGQKGAAEFWEIHDRMLAAKGVFDDGALLALAKDRGLDEARAKAVISDKDPATPSFDPTNAASAALAVIKRDQTLAADFDLSGPPTFFINGKRVVGVQPIDRWKTLIDAELANAEALVAAGTDKAAVYGALMAKAKEAELAEVRLIVPPTGDVPFRGNANASVELHAFYDFECVYCKRVENVIEQVETRFGDKVKIVLRDDPLKMHKTAPLASQAAREAFTQQGMAGFFKYHDALFDVQGTPDFERAGFERIAEKQGLDMGLFRNALSKETHLAAVERAIEEAKLSDIKGTPGFVVTYRKQGDKLEGYFFSGAVAFSKFKRNIERALESAAPSNVN